MRHACRHRAILYAIANERANCYVAVFPMVLYRGKQITFLQLVFANRQALGEDKLAWTIEIAFSLAFPSTINSSAVRLAKMTYQSYFFVQKIGRGRKLFACPNHRQLYPHLINSCIPWNPVEDGFIYSIKPKTFFLLLVGIDYKTFDGQGSLFIKTQE